MKFEIFREASESSSFPANSPGGMPLLTTEEGRGEGREGDSTE